MLDRAGAQGGQRAGAGLAKSFGPAAAPLSQAVAAPIAAGGALGGQQAGQAATQSLQAGLGGLAETVAAPIAEGGAEGGARAGEALTEGLTANLDDVAAAVAAPIAEGGVTGGLAAGDAASSAISQSLGNVDTTAVEQQLGEGGRAGGEIAGSAAGEALVAGAVAGGETAGREGGKRFGAGVGSALSALGGFFVARRVLTFFSGAIQTLARFQVVGAQTNAVIKSTGGIAGVSAVGVRSLAQNIEDLTTVDDKAVQAAENLLLTFTKVRNEAGAGNDIFDQATRSAVDLSVAMGTDASGAAIQLGKALNDPIQGVNALRRVGVSFTKEQREQIKALVDSGNQMEAQKLILAELTTEFGGSAEALGGTLQGKINRAGDAFEELQKKVASSIEPVVNVLGSIATVAADIPGPLIAIAAGFAGLVAAALTIRVAVAALKTFNAQLGITRALSLGQIGSGAAIAGLQNFAKGFAIGSVAIVGAVSVIKSQEGPVKDALKKIGEGTAEAADVVGINSVLLNKGLNQVARDMITFANSREGLRFIGDEARGVAAHFLTVASQSSNAADKALLLSAANRELREAFEAGQRASVKGADTTEEFAEAAASLTDEFIEQIDPLGQLSDAQLVLAKRYQDTEQSITSFQGVLDRSLGILLGSREAVSSFEAAIDDMSESLKENGRSFDLSTEKGRANDEALRSIVTASKDLVAAQVRQGAVADTVAAQNEALVDMLNEARADLPAVSKQFDAYIRSLGGVPGAVGPVEERLEALDATLESLKLKSSLRLAVLAEVGPDGLARSKELDKIFDKFKLNPRQRVAIEAAITGQFGEVRELDKRLVNIGVNKSIRTRIENAVLDDPNFSMKDLDTILRRVKLTPSLKTKVEAAVRATVTAEVKPAAITSQFGAEMRREFRENLAATTIKASLGTLGTSGNAMYIRGTVTAHLKHAGGSVLPGFHGGGEVPASRFVPFVVKHAGGDLNMKSSAKEVLALLEVGEFVIRERTATLFDRRFLEALNRVGSTADAQRIMGLLTGKLPGFHGGGSVRPAATRPAPGPVSAYHDGGTVSAAGSDSAVLAELKSVRQLLANLLRQPRELHVNGIQDDPVATALRIDGHLGALSVR